MKKGVKHYKLNKHPLIMVTCNVFEDWNEESVVPHISFVSIRIRFERKRPIRRGLLFVD